MKDNNKLHKLVGVTAVIAIITCLVYTLITVNISESINDIISLLLILAFTCLFVLYTFDNKKQIYSTLGSTTLVLFGVFTLVGTLGVSFAIDTNPNFTNQIYTEVLTWASEKEVEVIENYEYSDIIPIYHVIYQDIKTIDNKEIITITISEGPNPEKNVTIPIMNGWSDQQVLEFVEQNHLSNVEVNFIVSSKQKDTVIEQSYTGEMRRNDILTLTFSIGEEAGLADFEMPNLKDLSIFEATFKLKQKGVTTINYEYAYDDKIIKNNVSNQNVTHGDTVSPTNTEFILTISKGIEVTITDITNMNLDELIEWTTSKRLKLEITDNYHETIKDGMVIEANYKQDDIVEEGTIIKVTISKGPLLMEEFQSVNDFREWVTKYNIPYTENYEFNNDIAQGNIVSYSHETGQTIKTGETVTITISNGKAITIPNLINKTKTEIDKICTNQGFTCSYVYSYSSTTTKGYSMYQSKTVGTEVVSGTSISITLSNGPKPTSSSSSSNNDSNNNTTTTPPTPTCDSSITTLVYIQPGNTGTQTQSFLSSYFPQIKWNFNIVEACPNADATSGVVCNAGSIDMQRLNHCDTYTVTIVR